jgi:hypothetical protein
LVIDDRSVQKALTRQYGICADRQAVGLQRGPRRFEVPRAAIATNEPIQLISSGTTNTINAPGVAYEYREIEIINAVKPYVELIESLGEKTRSSNTDLAWEIVREGIATRAFSRITSRLRRLRTRDQPPVELIVRLARRLRDILPNIAKNPRLVLKRYRERLPLHQLREMDARCVDWLARQPGKTILQKAGDRRHVMGVIRQLSANTLENRVTAELVRQSVGLAKEYLSEYSHRFPDHTRIKRVRSFELLCTRLLRESILRDMSRLMSTPRPNYVLLNESRYHIIWKAYLQVVRREDSMANIRTWHQRTWSEAWQLCLWEQMDRFFGRSPARRAQLQLYDHPRHGTFIDARTIPSPWITAEGDQWEWVPGSHVGDEHLPQHIRDLAAIDSDWLIHHTNTTEHLPVVLGWTLAGISTSAIATPDHLKQLAQRIHRVNPSTRCRALIILAAADVKSVKQLRVQSENNIRVELWSWPLDVVRGKYDTSVAIRRWFHNGQQQ